MARFSFRRVSDPSIKEYHDFAGSGMDNVIFYIENVLSLTESDVVGGYVLTPPNSTSIIIESEEDQLSTIQENKKPFPLLDENSRDLFFQNPTLGDSYYNARLGGLREWYYGSDFGLWLNTFLIPCQNSNLVSVNRIVFIDGDDVYNSKEYPTVEYPDGANERRRSFGITVQNGLNNFISVAKSGIYYVDTNQTILAGEIVRADTDGTALGFSSSTVGGVGYALEDSGASILGKVLVKIGYNT